MKPTGVLVLIWGPRPLRNTCRWWMQTLAVWELEPYLLTHLKKNNYMIYGWRTKTRPLPQQKGYSTHTHPRFLMCSETFHNKRNVLLFQCSKQMYLLLIPRRFPLSFMFGSYSATPPHTSLNQQSYANTKGFRLLWAFSFLYIQRTTPALFLQAKPQQTEIKPINLGFRSVCQ